MRKAGLFAVFRLFPLILLPPFSDNKIFQVVQRLGKVKGLAPEYSSFGFVNIPEMEIEGLLQRVGDKVQGCGFSFFIEELTGRLERNGKLSHAVDT